MSSALTKKPICIGIIMDGNRRFAREHGIPTIEGHRFGYAKSREVAEWCKDAGIKYLILYAFSTENWNRSTEEVSYLVSLFKTLLFAEANDLQKEGIEVRLIGTLERFGMDFVKQALQLQASNPVQPAMTVVIALSYGGRTEITNAVNELLAEQHKGLITEKEIEKHLWTAGIPNPELIVRTGGDMRLSNFLPWQSVYSELFFIDTYWPSFTKEELNDILEKYEKRDRRIGK